MNNYLLWIFVGMTVVFNHTFLKDQNFRNDIPFLSAFQYGDFLIQKWMLVLIAFLIFGWWLRKQKNLLSSVKKYFPYVLIIAFVLIVTHLFSYQRWFEFDDFRVIGTHYDGLGTNRQEQMGLSNSTSYAIGMVYLVVRWFGTNFELYNTLGLIFYFLTSVTIFAIALNLSRNKFIALLAALFFATSPTYWRQILQMQEFIGDGFSSLLFALTIFQLVKGFYPGAVLSAAAALEFGLSRTHFISVPLFLMTLFLAPRNGVLKKNWFIAFIAFPIITLFYFPIFVEAFPESVDQVNLAANFTHLLRIADSVFAVSVPHEIAFQVIWFLRWLFDTRSNVSVALGIILICGILLLSFWLFRKGKILAGKLVLVGIITVVAAIALPTLSGIRIIQNLKDLTIQYDDMFPTAPTSYGVFSTLGMMFIVMGLGQVIRRKLFNKIMILLIIINGVTLIKSDMAWAKIYSTPERAINPQMEQLIPADGKPKVVFTPPPTQILSRYIDHFYQLHRIKEPLYIQNDAQGFIDYINKYQPDSDHVYAFVMDIKTYEVTDMSEKIRNYSTDELTPELLKTTFK